MTTVTNTDDIAAVLALRKQQLTTPQAAEQPPVVVEAEVVADTTTGEIIPASEAAPPAHVSQVHYPDIPPKVVGGLPYAADYWRMAQRLCRTEFIPDALAGRPDAVVACFMQGYELGIGPMQALNGINIIKGKPSLTAELMKALIIQAGHLIIPEVTNEKASIDCHRSEWPADKWVTVTWDLADAKNAGLSGDNWRKYPRAMLDARATSEAARRYFPDVIAGMSYTPEEVSVFATEANERGLSEPQEEVKAPTPKAVEEKAAEQPPVVVEAEVLDPTEVADTTSPEAQPASSPTPPMSTDASSSEAPTAEPKEPSVRHQMRGALRDLIKGLDRASKVTCQAWLGSHGYGDLSRLNEKKLQEAIDIVAGWPDSVAKVRDVPAAAPEPEDEEPEGDDDEALF